jgi:hypothetical protein
MKKLYKQLVNDIAAKIKRAPVYVAHCICGRYKATRSEIPVFIEIFNYYGIKVSERDFLQGTRLSNNCIFNLFRSLHRNPKHEKFKHTLSNTYSTVKRDTALFVIDL